jgi:hypothetical protein
MSLPKNPFVVSLSRKPFVVSLPNHAFGGLADERHHSGRNAKSVVRQAHHERVFLLFELVRNTQNQA